MPNVMAYSPKLFHINLVFYHDGHFLWLYGRGNVGGGISALLVPWGGWQAIFISAVLSL